MTERPSRKLAVILHADIAGSTTLVARDEAVAHAAFRRTFEQLAAFVGDYGGTTHEIRGDALVAEFARASDAVAAALAFQCGHEIALADLPGDMRPAMRIGISLGEVIVADRTITGTGVVLAQRLEQLADAGGVVVQGSVAETVPTRLPFVFEPMGEQVVKGFNQPVRAFTATLAANAALPGPEYRGQRDRDESSPREKPSIAALPFENLGGDPDQRYFADGMVEEIITGMSRIRWMTVIARNSSFAFRDQGLSVHEVARRLGVRYVLEGSVRRAGERVRINVTLIEAERAGHLWAERFEGALADVFELQDKIAAGVIGAIEPTVRQAEIERVKRKRPGDHDAYDLYLRAVAHMYEVTAAGREKAMDYVERALAIDPDYAEAHGVAAWCCFARSLWEGELTEAYREKALRHAHAVQAMQSADPTTLAHAAIALGMATRDFDAALEMIDRAVAINPSSAHAHGHGAVICTWSGRYDRAIELADKALKLSPFEPLTVMPLAATAGARLMRGEYDAAIVAARRALQIYPTHAPSHLITIASLVRSGHDDKARQAAAAYLAVAPTYRIGKRGFFLPGFENDFRRAGLPD